MPARFNPPPIGQSTEPDCIIQRLNLSQLTQTPVAIKSKKACDGSS